MCPKKERACNFVERNVTKLLRPYRSGTRAGLYRVVVPRKFARNSIPAESLCYWFLYGRAMHSHRAKHSGNTEVQTETSPWIFSLSLCFRRFNISSNFSRRSLPICRFLIQLFYETSNTSLTKRVFFFFFFLILWVLLNILLNINRVCFFSFFIQSWFGDKNIACE